MFLIGGVAFILVIVSVAYFASQHWDEVLFIWTMAREDRQGHVRLLCKTDHKDLLDACRELSRRVATEDLKDGKYYVRSDPHPEVAGFPKPILDLGPNCVFIDCNGRVMLEMMGGLNHFGVSAYSEDYKKPPFVGFKLGDKKLIDGLWYYDEGYEGNPRYQKKIDAMLQKGKEP